MKADAAQWRALGELAELDAELTRLRHRAAHLPERDEYDRLRGEHVAVGDRLAASRIALEDLDGQAARLEAEVDAVRQREDRDRGLLATLTDPKQLTDLQHELETLQRRQSSLEDSLLEVLEQREQLQAQQSAQSASLDELQADLTQAERTLAAVVSEVETTRGERSARRSELLDGLQPDVRSLYERQLTAHGVGAGQLRGGQCGACRIEIDRGELARISAAAEDEVQRCPECGAILLRSPAR